MPNHCENDLYIDGPQDDVNALLRLIGAGDSEPRFDFNTIVPYPSAYRERDDEFRAVEKDHGWQKAREILTDKYGPNPKDGYNSGGYEWCIANWGTKWGAYDVARRDYGGVCLTFQTAWSPPSIEFLATLHQKFPTLTFHLEWFERGAALCGGVSFETRDDWDGEGPWIAGTPVSKWEAKYEGHRGG